MNTFPLNLSPQTEKSAKTLSLSAGFTQLRRLADGSRVKAYILDHEASALVLLAVSLIAGTVFYVDLRPRLHAESEPPQNGASLKLAAAPIPQRLSDVSSAPLVQEAASNMDSITSNPTSSTSPDQPAGLVSSGKRDNQLIHRKAIHHHHHRR
jgi:hypothetical protein